MKNPREESFGNPEIDKLNIDIIKMGQKVGEAMERMRENPHLVLSHGDINDVLRMDDTELSVFLSKKGIDFEKPVMLTTPTGTAEAWMQSKEQIRDFLRRNESVS